MISDRRITKQELARYNGENGAPVYIAYNGLVYDVSRSYHWRGGRHWVTHNAGGDLTGYMAEAPHGAELLDKFPVIGILDIE